MAPDRLALGNQSQPADLDGHGGGLVARGLSGSLRQRHLGVRDQIIGIGLIRSDGVEAHAGGRVVKNVAGYDLMRLLCGSWGSLALISELTLRVQPIRPARALLQLHGDLPQLEAWRAAVVASSLTPELLQWKSHPDQPVDVQVGIASVSDVAVDDQLNRLEDLAGLHQLSAERHPGMVLCHQPSPWRSSQHLPSRTLPPGWCASACHRPRSPPVAEP